MGEKVESFKCPICGSMEYYYKLPPGVFGGGSYVEYYICKGCSVIFGDLKKFTRAKKE